MPQGICKECGAAHYGWALMQEKHRVCQCGGKIIVKEDPVKEVK